MQKRIRVEQLRTGMHLHALEGNWLDHPFWKSKFVISDQADIDKLLASGIGECWIDTAKGIDVDDGAAAKAPPPPVAVPPAAAAAATSAVAPAAAAPRRPPRVALDEEASRAAAVLKRSRQLVKSLLDDARLGRAPDTEACRPLVDDVVTSVGRHPDALISLARLKQHDDYSYLHSVSVAALMIALAQRLGLDDAQMHEAGMAGMLHDIGKAVMPLDVLNKPARLTDAEYAVMKTHPRRGHEILRGCADVGAVALDVCLHHHERPDGAGYPDGLSGDALTLHARMGAVCDVYDAITSNRPYKAGWDPAEALARMYQWTKQGQFDASVFKAFVDSVGIYPTGSLVRLQSGRLAVVAEQNAGAPTTPRVKVFFSTKSRMPLPVELIDLSRSSDRIVERESNAEWRFPHLAELVTGAELLRAGPRAAQR